MNKINRPLVKSQARQIIKDKVFYLFIISIIVSILSGSLASNLKAVYNLDSLDNEYNNYNNFNYYYDDSQGGGNYDNFGNYFEDGDSSGGNPIEDFQFDSSAASPEVSAVSVREYAESIGTALSGFSSLSFIISVIFTPLTVTLCGIYLSLIRRQPDEEFKLGKELGGLFKNSFNETFLKKLLVVFLRGLFAGLWSLLLVVPGIVYFYSSYFAYQLMHDYPNLKPTEALRLSKKIVKGNRGELFVLNLSFILWGLLCIITCGIASIYVIPYVKTTDALYYENFRLRALQDGRITEADFLSDEETFYKYNASSSPYYTPGANAADSEQNNCYRQAPFETQGEYKAENQNNYYNPANDYYTPPEDTDINN